MDNTTLLVMMDSPLLLPLQEVNSEATKTITELKTLLVSQEIMYLEVVQTDILQVEVLLPSLFRGRLLTLKEMLKRLEVA